MPSNVPRQPRYCLHKSSNRAYVRIDGRWFNLGSYGSDESRTEYDRLVAIWLANGRRMPDTGGEGAITVAEVIHAYWKHATVYYRKPDGRRTSEVNIVKYALRPLRQLFGRMPAVEFTVGELSTIQEHLIGTGAKRETINSFTQRIRRVFRWAGSKGMVPADLYLKLRALESLKAGRSRATESKMVTSVDPGVLDAVLPDLPRPVRGILQVMRHTGCRGQEARIMRGRDIDMTRSDGIWIYEPSYHKNVHRAKRLLIPLGPNAQAVVREFLQPNTQDYLFRPCDAGNGADKHSVNPCYTKDSVGTAIKRACDRVGVPRFSAHQIRHLVATEREREFGLEGSRATLGHSSVSTTRGYVDEDLERTVRMASKVG